MKLSTLLNSLDYQLIEGTPDKDIEKLVYHSDEATPGSIFFAAEGFNVDGKKYIKDAIAKGAGAIVTSGEPEGCREKGQVTFISVEDVRHAMAVMAGNFYGNPSCDLLVIGVTGTKGKTSTAFMIRKILEEAGIRTGIIGTVYTGWEGNLQSATHTTPESVEIQRMLWEMRKAGCKAVVIEVSSQGLKHSRVDAIDFDIGVFTNISPDHISDAEHRDYEEYRYWKSRLFKKCHRAVVNIDDREWPQMVRNTDLEQIVFYGHNREADFRIGRHKLWKDEEALGSQYLIISTGPCGDGKTQRISLQLPGDFNIENSAAAIAVTRALGIPWGIITETLERIRIPGRVEPVPTDKGYKVIVDYAHNGVALESLLKSIRKYHPSRLILVFGCGGNRDKNRRSEMGRVASRFADVIIVTSDNPRHEAPEDIIAEIKDSIRDKDKVHTVKDRSRAIGLALQEGAPGDIIVIAGKGHETYQIIGDDVYHFDDREEVLRLLGAEEEASELRKERG